MPTAARLVAAICLGLLAYIVSGMIMTLMPPTTDFGYFVPLNVFLGVIVGWTIMGPRVGRGTTAAINNGLTGVAVLVLWGIGAQACYEMFRLAMKKRYDGPIEAIAATFQIAAEFGLMIATMPILLFLVVAATIAGLIAEFVGNRWP